MKRCVDTITVFNKRWDAAHGFDRYIPTVIHGVSWFGEVVSNVTDKGLNATNRYAVRIPADADAGGKSYTSGVEYEKAADVSALYTLKSGDIVVKASIDIEMTLAQVHDQYADCFTILGVTDNLHVPNAPHLKVVGS